MYVKLFNKILDSSIAANRPLRHFFTDLLLCSDQDGNVIMTNEAIHRRTGASMEEVEWGLAELSKPDQASLTPESGGRRIIPLEGHGYGWKIVNYATYRDYRTASQLREASSQRVRRYRLRNRKVKSSHGPLPGETAYVKALDNGDDRGAEAIEDGEADRLDELHGRRS